MNFIDTSKITDMFGLFTYIAHDFDISNWNVSNVTSMNFMFCWCKNFDGKGIENWNVENITDATYMFCGCEKFNCDLSNWNIEKTTPIKDMFFNYDKNIIPDWY